MKGGIRMTEAHIKAMQPRPKSFKVFDGEGFYLEIYPDGKKRWRTQYRIDGKARIIAHGVWPKVSLKEARERHAEARKLIAQGIDPLDVRHAEKRGEADRDARSFGAILDAWQRHKAPAWSAAHARITAQIAAKHLAPALAEKPVDGITPQELLAIARRIEKAGRGDTARRVISIASQVFNHARLCGMAQINPADAVKGALAPAQVAAPMGYTTDPARLAAFLDACANHRGTAATRYALALAPYLLLRPGELRSIEWPQVDMERAEIRLPLASMKRRRQEKQARGATVAHIVPLSRQALALFKALAEEGRGKPGGFVFAAKPGGPAISDATLARALQRMGEAAEGLTIHGWRHAASTILHENGWQSHVIEKQLAHKDANRIRGIYNHAEYLPERRGMMQAWADYLDNIKGRAEATPPPPPVGMDEFFEQPPPPGASMHDQIFGTAGNPYAGMPDNLADYLRRKDQARGDGDNGNQDKGGDDANDMG